VQLYVPWIVEKQQAVSRLPRIVPFHRFRQRDCYVRTSTLQHERDAGVRYLLQREQGLLGTVLIVKQNQLQLAASQHAAAGVDRVDCESRAVGKKYVEWARNRPRK
jgi:hypothetical protein